uniref:G-protein coupled receptors family 1 profile domain-containing protein n=1 Tax=Photinus pyralis TaxID=7054 RepID=A0A1Y1LCU3_PHOPY
MSQDTTPETIFTNNSTIAIPDTGKHFQELAFVALLSVVIVITVIGNTLVILAVLTTRRLRTVTNCFVISLAIADWLVGVFVMPPAIANHLMGTWELGWVLCDIWVSLDILLCTASILSLCAISVDRYLAVTQPLSYSRRRRSKRLASSMILVVWFSSALITCPPMFGWYEPGRHEDKNCRYNRNTGYVIFSAMGSFFIPMVVMVYVYARISCVVAQRHDQLAHMDNKHRVRSMRNFYVSTNACCRNRKKFLPALRTILKMRGGLQIVKNKR